MVSRKKKPTPDYQPPDKKPFRENLIKGFNDLNSLREKRGEPLATRGEFMRLTYPGRYNSDASAARAYNKIFRRETSGKELAKQASLVGPTGYQTMYFQDEEGNITKRERIDSAILPATRRKRYGASSRGYWKVNVTFIYPDANGNPDLDPEMLGAYTRSFTVFSYEHIDYENRGYIEEALQDVIEYKVIDWQAGIDYDGGIPDGWISYSVEVFPVETTTLAFGPTDRLAPEIHHNQEVVVLEDLRV